MLQEAARQGGTPVYVHRDLAPSTRWEYSQLPRRDRSLSGWRQMKRDLELVGRGKVRHPDRATLVLRGWHRVLMNTTHHAAAMRYVAFLD